MTSPGPLDVWRALRSRGLPTPPAAPGYLEAVRLASDALERNRDLLPPELRDDPVACEAVMRWGLGAPPRGARAFLVHAGLGENETAYFSIERAPKERAEDSEEGVVEVPDLLVDVDEAPDGRQPDDPEPDWKIKLDQEDERRRREREQAEHLAQELKNRRVQGGTRLGQAFGDQYREWRPRPS